MRRVGLEQQVDHARHHDHRPHDADHAHDRLEQRLSASEWDVYKTKNGTFVATTNKSVAKSGAAARSPAARPRPTSTWCMGDAPSQEIAATTDLGRRCTGSIPAAAACTDALNAYIGALDQWRSVVQSVDDALERRAAVVGCGRERPDAIPVVQSSAKTFVKECKPVGS